MNQFIQQLSNLSLGQAILIACSVLLSLFVVAVLKQLFSTKSPSKSSSKSSPVNPVRIDPVLNQTLTKAEKLEEKRVFALPDDINGEVSLTVGSLKYDKHRFDHILGTMKIQNRRLHFPQISLVNADALISGALIIEEKSPEIFSISDPIMFSTLRDSFIEL